MKTLTAGSTAPDFELPDQYGTATRLGGLLRGGPVVLFFYPAALTVGCTKEGCHFRDMAADFAAAGAQRVGISLDPVEKQQRFSDAHGFDFPLLSDPDGKVARRYGVRRRFLTPVKRTTFVIAPDGVVTAVVNSELNMHQHADQALEAVRTL